MTAGEPLRIGVLGASRIAEAAIVVPARKTGARLVAVAARDRDRAETFAAGHGFERAYDDYAALLADADVEVVYNPLVNALHAPWNLRAIAAGKHVLSEKPFASNAAEAAEVRDAAAGTGLVVMEAFHYLFHPVTQRLLALLDDGTLGDLERVEAVVNIPAPPEDDPRWSLPLAGGALMDLGCYGLHAHRLLSPRAGGEPRVVSARAAERAGHPGVDEWFDVDLEFPSGVTGSARCHMAAQDQQMTLEIIGSRGRAMATSFVLPHLDDRVLVEVDGRTTVEEVGRRSSYAYQLEAFAAAVREGAPLPLDADDAVRSMQLVDDAYLAAGLEPRPRWAG